MFPPWRWGASFEDKEGKCTDPKKLRKPKMATKINGKMMKTVGDVTLPTDNGVGVVVGVPYDLLRDVPTHSCPAAVSHPAS